MNPLSALFGVGVALRNTLFDRKLLPCHRLSRPVISVGNLSAGGSGKTPFVIALGELLSQRGIRYDVLSRGYRRKTHGVRVVEPNGTPAEFGDEPLLIARRLGIPVVVGESRHDAGRLAEEKFDSQLHILDDGFQHRSLQRDFDIVLITADDVRDRLLPGGRLREPLSSLKRAHAIVLARELSPDHPAFAGKLIWRTHRELTLATIATNPIAFCGIARPSQFFAQLRTVGISPVAEVTFPDHHSYDRGDRDHLRAMQRERGAGGFITTEKDAINLGPFLAELQPVAVAGLRLMLDRPADLVDTILARIADR